MVDKILIILISSCYFTSINIYYLSIDSFIGNNRDTHFCYLVWIDKSIHHTISFSCFHKFLISSRPCWSLCVAGSNCIYSYFSVKFCCTYLCIHLHSSLHTTIRFQSNSFVSSKWIVSQNRRYIYNTSISLQLFNK